MLSYSLSLESILVNTIGLLVVLLLASMIALASSMPDHRNDTLPESKNEYARSPLMKRSRSRTLESEQGADPREPR